MSAQPPVITGLGVVASIGVGRDAFAQGLSEGRSGLDDLVSFDAEDTGRERAAEIREFDETPWLRTPKNYLDRNSALAFAACEMAVRECGVELPDDGKTAGIAFGSAAGNIESLALFHEKVAAKGPRFAPPFLFPHAYQNTTLGLLSIEYAVGGPHECFCSGGVSGLEAVAFGASAIREARTPLMLAGGGEAFNEPLFRAAVARGWLSPLDGGEEGCRPFGIARNGTLLGEGAVVVAIEDTATAQAPALSSLLGNGVATTPGAAMGQAMESAGLQASDVRAVFAAAGGYEVKDAAEADALRALFGEGGIPIVTLKALLGETLGASGALNLAAALEALKTKTLPGIPMEYDVLSGLDLVREPRPLPDGPILVNACHPGAARWLSLAITA